MAEGCQAFDADLSAWIDGELAPARRAEVEAHLGACSRCAGRVEELRAVDRALADLAAPAVAVDLRARLERRLAAGRDADRARPPLRHQRFAPLLALPAAAAAVLALYLLVRPAGPPAGALPVAKAPSPELPEPARTEAAEPRIAGRPDPEVAPGELEALDPDLLAVAFELDTIEDLPVIANLELLERMLEAEAG